MFGKYCIMPHYPGQVGCQEGNEEVVVDPDSAAPQAGTETEDRGCHQKEEDGDGKTSHRDLIDCHSEKVHTRRGRCPRTGKGQQLLVRKQLVSIFGLQHAKVKSTKINPPLQGMRL